jgi:polar amino acid transport system substrate-binding protein
MILKGPLIRHCLGIFLLLLGACSFADSNAPYENMLAKRLQQTRSQACSTPSNELASVLCAGKIRIGVRTNYPGFGVGQDGKFEGFEVQAAQDLALKLGVAAEFVPVTAVNRIEKLIKGEVDLVWATMAHTTTREKVIHFVRPHYYSSPTAIVGPRKIKVQDWADLSGRSVCVPLGNYSNIVFSEHQVRMMIYDRPDRMLEAFKLGACSLIAHDQSLLFGSVLKDANANSSGSALEEKFSFNDVPWGVGVRKSAADSLGLAVSLIIADMHQSGRLLEVANQHGIQMAFLEKQQSTWKNPECFNTVEKTPDTECHLKPVNLTDPPSSIEGPVSAVEQWLADALHWQVRFPMLSGSHGLRMLLSGTMISVVIVLLSIFSTLFFSCAFYWLFRSPSGGIRAAGAVVRLFFQNSPIILLLSLGYLLSTVFLDYSSSVAVLIAVFVIGLNNGANGANALIDASLTFKSAFAFQELLRVSSVPLRAAVINAAKASPVAAFIGAPEMLASLTDITSFTGERVTTYVIVSVFYILIIQLVIVMTGLVLKRMQRHA